MAENKNTKEMESCTYVLFFDFYNGTVCIFYMFNYCKYNCTIQAFSKGWGKRMEITYSDLQ